MLVLNNLPEKILVTGGAGFIGSHICRYLLNNYKAKVICLDNLSNGWPGNIMDLEANPNFELAVVDITDIKRLKANVEGCDWVFHQAAVGSVPRSFTAPLYTHGANSTGFLNLLECIRSSSVSKLVYASSSSVYGDSPTLPKVESQTGKLLSPYAITKFTNEAFARTLLAGTSVQHVGLRYFNVFGPNQNPNGPYAAVIPKFIQAALLGNAMEIYGDGNQSRDFTYVQNVVHANIHSATVSLELGTPYILNIGCGERITILELAQSIERHFGLSNTISHVPERNGDIRDSLADITLARQTIQYNPAVSVLNGLDIALSWYQQHPNFFG